MSVHVEQFGLDEAAPRFAYETLFEHDPDAFIQQSTAWAEAIAPLGPDEPIFLLARRGDEAVAGLPLYLFRAKSGNILTSVPQPGPLGGVFVKPGIADPDSLYAALLKHAAALAQEQMCLALTVITNPFSDDSAFYRRHLEPDLQLENFTQYVDLSKPPAVSENAQRNLKKAKAAGLTLQDALDEKDVKAWHALHEKRQGEIGAKPLSPKLVLNLWRSLTPRGKGRLILVKDKDALVAGAFYVLHRRVVDVYMPAAESAYDKASPNFLNVGDSLAWAREFGARWYHWQSSPGRDSGVYRFKAQWGSDEAPYYFMTKLFCDPERILAIGAERARTEYAGHYLVPHGAFETRFEKRSFKK